MASTVSILTNVSVCVSLVGCLLIIALNFRFQEYRNNFFRNLVFILSIYDALLSLAFLIPNNNRVMCDIQGHVLIGVALLPPHISAIISLLTYLKISKRVKLLKLRKISKVLHLIAVVHAILMSTISIGSAKNYKFPHTNWCFAEAPGWLLTFYIFIWIDILINIVFYSLIVNNIAATIKKYFRTTKTFLNSKSDTIHKKEIRLQLRMSIIPLSLILALSWSSVKRVLELLNKDIPSWLNYMHAISNPSQGISDCIVFVLLSSYSRKKLKEMFFCKPSVSINFTTEEIEQSSLGSSRSENNGKFLDIQDEYKEKLLNTSSDS
ncbi:g protein-coupled receptor [Anaeramoeba flamelloides]|uniref:G protein-coupled receptor n=1 Tax=Anaeramoeba flamelloides TaxID=1746091 RepID=A0AAV8ABB2_9EUKA|nr:g protein-coupled receptor [Anaeramoeba flamelloides]